MQPPWSKFRLFNRVAAFKEAEFGGNQFGRIRQEIVRDGLPGVTVVTLLASPHDHSLRKVALLRVTARYCFWDLLFGTRDIVYSRLVCFCLPDISLSTFDPPPYLSGAQTIHHPMSSSVDHSPWRTTIMISVALF